MSEENKAVVRRVIQETFNKGNLDVADETVANDYVGHDPDMPEEVRGSEGFKQYVGMLRSAFPDLHVQIEDQVAEGDRVATRYVMSGTHEGDLMGIPPTSNRIEIAGMSIDHVSGGKLAESWDSYDALGMMQQLGVIPSPEPSEGVADPEEVLSYWFPPGIHEADAETYRAQILRWFGGGPEVDKEITERFGPLLEQARRGELDHWAETPRGRLALILVLDQFSRSVYKGTPLAYAQDPAALRLAQEGIEAGMENEMEPAERLFFTIPLGHAEGPDHLERLEWGVRYGEEMVDLAPPHLRAIYEFSAGQAKGHRDVIARFGRHPHRNEVLGRASTPEELEYLRDETPVHMRRPPEG